MANKQAAKKALRSSERKNLINNSRKSRIRTFIRKVQDAIKSENKQDAVSGFKILESEMMKGVSKNLFHVNNAARKLSRLNKKIKNISS